MRGDNQLNNGDCGDLIFQSGSDGFVWIKSRAIILKNGKILMMTNSRCNYYYPVGGSVKFFETAQEACVREVFEETGFRLSIDRLGFVQEAYFVGDGVVHFGKLIYEIAYFFYMDVPDDFEPVCRAWSSEFSVSEKCCWLDLNELCGGKFDIYPQFFRKELLSPSKFVKYFLIDERERASF